MAIGVTIFMGIKIPEKDRGQEFFTPDWFDGPVPESVAPTAEQCEERMGLLGYKSGEFFIARGPMVLKGRMSD